LAFALTLIESGVLSRKQIAQAVRDWTIHGDLTLHDHLNRKGLFSDDEHTSLEEKADSKLQKVLERLDAADPNTSSIRESIVQQLDQYGRVATVLGLSANDLANSQFQRRVSEGCFQLLRIIGQGGLGVVWLARDEKLKRIVAIKEILRESTSQSPEVKRFQRKAEITGRLEHPSIVPLYQFGLDEQTVQPFYVMRYIGKKTLEDAIDEFHERRQNGEENSLQMHNLLNAFVSVCQAIAYAHSRNIIHRDLKPENVALDNYGQVIVLDWGLAMLTGEYEIIESCELGLSGSGTGVEQTQDGQILGTPNYMAPEQASGRIDDIDERTDVYGLGAVLYAILTGCAPHEKSQESMTASSQVSELLRKIVSEPTVRARSLNTNVPRELEAIAAKALSLKPYARYQTALQLAGDVQSWLANEPVKAYKEPWKKRAARWIGNHKLFSRSVGTLLTIFLVGSISFGIATSNAIIAEREREFESLKSEARELEMTIQSRIDVHAQHLRFMSNVPPVQAIVSIRSEAVDKLEDSEEVWNQRLELIYSGLLGVKPDHLSISFIALETLDDNAFRAQELVRVERNQATGTIRSVPVSRLQSFEAGPAIKKVAALEYGDYHIEENSLEADGNEDFTSDSIGLGGIPVFDDATGELFGAVVIEGNMEAGLRKMLDGALRTAEEVFAVNSNHRVILHYDQDDGFQSGTRGQGCDCLPLSVQKYLIDDKADNQFTEGRAIVVRKIRFSDKPDADWLGLVLMLKSD
ncbi:MAG: serine/threonine protein kinase, partial [Planctomicrobium sp.]|nr:serine/threonine protein kinase [Planctomicrobium sp.]